MLALDFDIIGTLIFLWFIFSGISKSKAAKIKNAERQRNEPRTKTMPRPQVFEQTGTETKREARPAPKTETIPMPSWFPFPLEIPSGDGEVKKKVTAKNKPSIPEQTETLLVQPKAKVKEKVVSTVNEVQENQWRAQRQGFTLDKDSVVNGMIWAEVLGPPRSKKKLNYR